MQALKILFVTPQYLPAIGGTEQHVAGWAEELARRGHAVSVFTTRSTDQPTWRGDLPPREQRNGVEVRRFQQWQRGPRTLRLMNWGYNGFIRTGASRYEAGIWLSEGPFSPALFAALLTKARHFDVVISMSASTLTSVVSRYATRRAGAVWINVPQLHLDQLLARPLVERQRLFDSAAFLLPETRIEAQAVQERFGVAGQRIEVVPPVIPEPPSLPEKDAARARLNLPKDAFIVTFLARKVAYKGFHQTAQAVSLLLKQSAAALLLSAGPGDSALPPEAQSAAMQTRWRDLGIVDEATKWDVLAAGDVLCMPSTGEAFGIVYAEAWLCGKPVIGANSGAVPSVIEHGVDGFIVQPGDAPALAGLLAYLEQHPRVAQRMGAAGRRKTLTHFSAQQAGDLLEGAISRALRLAARGRAQSGLSALRLGP